jgi:hypothetical protein
MARPALLRAPAKTLASAVFCAGARQLPSRAALQVGTSVSSRNRAWQAFTSETMPSASPSSASQRASTRRATSCSSAGVKALWRSGWPVGVVALATLAYCCAP